MRVSLRRECLLFALVLAALVVGFFHPGLFLGQVLSPDDVLFVTRGFEERRGPDYEPKNRLLMDPVLQFEPWIAFNRSELRAGRLPLWNPYVGCGAPHLANGQSAVFDPFLLIDYLGPFPASLAWVSAARLWFAGMGMYLLARRLGFGGWGRWFAGLTFPFCGFVMVWLLYPVTSAAVWLPWILLATDKLSDQLDLRSVALLGLCVGGCFLGGHVQTSAHVILVAMFYAVWLGWRRSRGFTIGWASGVLVGLLIAAIEIIPLGFYLSRSPVWADRGTEHPAPWILEKPRLLDTACVAVPYAYGSQRRGHPNLARAFGVHNLNESAGGFCGLATLIWLAPLAWSRRKEQPVVLWLVSVAVFGLCASLRIPLVDNLLRLLPVLRVMDHRRMSLYLAFALSLLGGMGLDAIPEMRFNQRWRIWSLAWVVAAAICLLPAVAIGRFEGKVRSQARDHYLKMARQTPGADPAVYQNRADRQTRNLIRFIPRYYSTVAIQLLGLAGIFGAVRACSMRRELAQALLMAVVLADLVGFGYGLNPMVSQEDCAYTPPIVDDLRAIGPGRVIAIGEELPPNTLMRYGLSDVRNYDSVEYGESVTYFEELFEADDRGTHSSRREVTWEGVDRSRDRLIEAGVRMVVAAVPPPPARFEHVRRLGNLWLVELEGKELCPIPPTVSRPGHYVWNNAADLWKRGPRDGRFIVREMAVPGWRAWVNGEEVSLSRTDGPFLSLRLNQLERVERVELRYDPLEVRIALFLSFFGLLIFVFALTLSPIIRSTRIMRERLGRTQAAGLRS